MDRDQRRRLTTAIGATTAVGGLWLAAPEVYTGTFSDLDSFIRVLALVLALATWAFLIRRLISNRVARAVAGIGPVAVVAAAVLWPYLRPSTEVNEAFPTTDESSVVAAPTSTTATSTTSPLRTTTSAAPTTTITTTTTTVPTEPVELRRAGFQGLAGHRGSGDAAIYRLPDQSILLRFEEVDIGSGPALNVYLVPGDDQRDHANGIHVAPLTAEKGNQNYTLPDGIDLTGRTWTVLVWCETFAVEVANATLA